uniref:Uncharacterized protein n=1 Tax=Tolypothrix bouteillei VB521301 TaxID=1479485 RepID=A0A0C1RP74_9CYAN
MWGEGIVKMGKITRTFRTMMRSFHPLAGRGNCKDEFALSVEVLANIVSIPLRGDVSGRVHFWKPYYKRVSDPLIDTTFLLNKASFIEKKLGIFLSETLARRAIDTSQRSYALFKGLASGVDELQHISWNIYHITYFVKPLIKSDRPWRKLKERLSLADYF